MPQRYKVLFDNAPLAMIEVDLGPRPPLIRAANEQALRTYRRAIDDLVGQPLDVLFADGCAVRLARAVQDVRRGRPVVLEIGQVRLGGEGFIARVHIARLPCPEGVGAILMVDDISAECRRRDDLAAIDRDRRRIAHEIHDGLAQSLNALRLRAARWTRLLDHDPGQLRAELATMIADLTDDIREARRAIFALRPVRLEAAGLEASLRLLVDEMAEQYDLAIDLDIRDDAAAMPAALDLPVLRIVQEALNNVGRHARARHVALRLDHGAPGTVVLTVCDDGIGFDPTILTAGRTAEHFGLLQMRERVQAYGGALTISSEDGAGVSIRVELPVGEPRP